MRPVVGDHPEAHAQCRGRCRERPEHGDGQPERAAAEDLLWAQEHRVHAGRVLMVLFVAPAGGPVEETADGAGRPGVQDPAVDRPFDERLRGQHGSGDRGVRPAEAPAGEPHGRDARDGAQQHRRAGMGQETAGGIAEGGDLGRPAVRTGPVQAGDGRGGGRGGGADGRGRGRGDGADDPDRRPGRGRRRRRAQNGTVEYAWSLVS